MSGGRRYRSKRYQIQKSQREQEIQETGEPQRFRDKYPRKKQVAPIWYLVGAAAIVLLIGYGIGVVYYSSHFYGNVWIDGVKAGGKTEKQMESFLTEQNYDAHKITLKEKDGTESIDPMDIHLEINVGTQIADRLKSQSSWGWPFHFFGKKKETIAFDITYDEAALKNQVDSLKLFEKDKVKKSKDASIKPGKKKFKIVKETIGNEVNKEKLLEQIQEAFMTGVTEIDLEKSNLYKTPDIKASDKAIRKALKQANQYAKSKLTYDFQYTTVVVDYSKFKNWVDFSDDYKKVTLNDEKLNEYMTKLCRDFNTIGIARKFKTTGGDEITITEGDYGWQINYDAELAKLEENIKSGKKVTREPIYAYRGKVRKGPADDIGKSYVEVCIADQMVYLYMDGQLIVSSSVVTGDVTQGDGSITHKGIYGISYKQRNATLVGENYESKVSFWMPFNENEGLHDAPWRKSFGGGIYQGNGSHGCVNCPPNVAKTIYKYVDTGFPVIIY